MALALVVGLGGSSLSGEVGQGGPKLQAVLRSLIHHEGPLALRGKVFPLMPQSVKLEGKRVQVVIETLPEAKDGYVIERVIEAGGEVELTYGSWIQALVPAGELEPLAALPEVRFIRLPVRPVLMQGAVRSEGVAVIGSQSWNEAGLDGAGVKVGIIDSGYSRYERLLGRELPPKERVLVRSFRADKDIECSDCSFVEQVHGLGVAEVVYDIAPGARFVLTNIDTDVAFRRAIDWMIAQEVDVVNTSLGFPSGCFGEGEGIFSSQLKKARESGITWATAAGNEATSHWEGEWSDPDGDNLHNYTATDEGNTLNVTLTEFEYPDGRRVATSIIEVIFSWDAPCGSASDDYELVVMREEDGKLVPLHPWDEERHQGQMSDWIWRPGIPIKRVFASEDFDVSRVGDTEKYHLAIRKKRAQAADSRFDMLIGCPCSRIEYRKRMGSVSILEPSISPSVITVGAVHHSPNRCPRSLCPDGLLLVYSSRGPTKDGRIKPDIAAPSHVSTTAFRRWTGEGGRGNSGFTGTSAASPHVAGAAALVVQALYRLRGRRPSPDEVQAFLERRAEDVGTPGKDNKYGAGVLLLGPPPSQPAVRERIVFNNEVIICDNVVYINTRPPQG